MIGLREVIIQNRKIDDRKRKKMSLFVNARKFTLKGNISESKN